MIDIILGVIPLVLVVAFLLFISIAGASSSPWMGAKSKMTWSIADEKAARGE